MTYSRHPTAIVESNDIGDGSKIWHFVHIRAHSVVGRNCNIGKSVYVDTDVRIGDNVKIQNFVSIYKGVELEDDVFVGPSAVFTNDLRPRAFIWEAERIVPTRVRKGSSIGANATILCGITIGEYAMVGAGSVVTKDVPPFGLVYGNPAQLRGFVCYCGNKLNDISLDKAEDVVSMCSCGKTVEIKKEWMECG